MIPSRTFFQEASRVLGLGFRVLGFRVQGSRVRVQGSRV